jgi:hypothetical protein
MPKFQSCLAGSSTNDDDAQPVLVCWYPRQYCRLIPRARSTESTPRIDEDGKWWADDDEPLYCIVARHAVVIGRPCDTDDRVEWLMQHGKFEAAMQAAVAARYVNPATWRACSTAFLNHLLQTPDFAGAPPQPLGLTGSPCVCRLATIILPLCSYATSTRSCRYMVLRRCVVGRPLLDDVRFRTHRCCGVGCPPAWQRPRRVGAARLLFRAAQAAADVGAARPHRSADALSHRLPDGRVLFSAAPRATRPPP